MIPIPAYFARTLRVSVRTLRLVLQLPFGGQRRPQVLRAYFQDCGGAFLKVGQLLGMRYDLLPPEFCNELGKLFDRLPPEPPAKILAAIAREFGRPAPEVFCEFNPVARSAASVAQVHDATLPDGSRVVVKVKRSGIDIQYRVDLLNVRVVTAILDFLGVFPSLDLPVVTREICRLAWEELDFLREARNIHVLHEALSRDDIDHCAPKVRLELSTASVIVMERFTGVWMTELLDALDQGDAPRLAGWAGKGIHPPRCARLLFRSVLEQCFTHRVFHADPHAGNLVFLEGGTLGYVDFGMVGWLDERAWERQWTMNRQIASGNVHGAYEAMVDGLGRAPESRRARFESEFKRLLQDWLVATRIPGPSLAERSNGHFLLRMLDLLRREGLRMPAADLRLNRMLIIADIIVLRLDPDMERLPELRSYFRDEASRRLLARIGGEFEGESAVERLVRWSAAFGTWPDVAQKRSDRHRRVEGTATWDFSRRRQFARVTLRYLRVLFVMLLVYFVVGGIVNARVSAMPGRHPLEALIGGWWFWSVFLGILTLWVGSAMKGLR